MAPENNNDAPLLTVTVYPGEVRNKLEQPMKMPVLIRVLAILHMTAHDMLRRIAEVEGTDFDLVKQEFEAELQRCRIKATEGFIRMREPEAEGGEG